MVSRLNQAERLLDLGLNLVGQLGIVFEIFAHVLTALTQLVAVVGEPGARLLDDIALQRHIDDRAFLGNAFAIEHVELGGLEWRRHLVLDNLDPGTAADGFVPVLQGLNTTNVKTHRRIELQRLAAGGSFRIAEEHTDLLAQLIDENRRGVGLREGAGHLAQRLAHQTRLKTDMAVAHIAFDLSLRHQRGHRIDDDHVKRTRPDEHIRDFQCLLAVVWLGYDQ